MKRKKLITIISLAVIALLLFIFSIWVNMITFNGDAAVAPWLIDTGLVLLLIKNNII